jgi:hypothetical protein
VPGTSNSKNVRPSHLRQCTQRARTNINNSNSSNNGSEHGRENALAHALDAVTGYVKWRYATIAGNGEKWMWDRFQNTLSGFSFCTRTQQKWKFEGSYVPRFFFALLRSSSLFFALLCSHCVGV